MDNFIEINNASFSYVNDFEERSVKNTVIKDVSLKIDRGEFVAVLGHKGRTKSLQHPPDGGNGFSEP